MTVEILDIPIEEQHAIRDGFLGSTEVSALFPGCNPYMTRLELALRKNGEIPSNIEETVRMRLGKHCEAGITAAANDTWPELDLQPDKRYYVNRAERRATSLDNRAARNDLAEIKMVDYLAFRDHWIMDEGAEEAPPHIEFQVQQQMDLTGTDGCHIIACVGGSELHKIYRERDDDIILQIREECAKFWSDLDQGILPPAQPEQDYLIMTQLYSKVRTGEVADATDELADLLSQYKDARDRYNACDKESKVLKAKIFELVGTADRVAFDDGLKGNFTMTKDSAGTLVTEDMVGTYIGSKKGYRQLRVTLPKEKK